VGRLWARATNAAYGSTLSVSLRRAGLTEVTDQTTEKNMTPGLARELSVLVVTGLISPGANGLAAPGNRVCFPGETKKEGSPGHGFGALVIGETVHVVVDVFELRWAARGIDAFLMGHLATHTDFKLFLHLTIRNCTPEFHREGMPKWPLSFLPSIIAYWHVELYPRGFPDHVEFWTPGLPGLHRAFQLHESKNWLETSNLCGRIQRILEPLIKRAFRAEARPAVSASTPQNRPPSVSESASYTPLTDEAYEAQTGVRPYGKRGRAKQPPPSELESPHGGSIPTLEAETTMGVDYDGPHETSTFAASVSVSSGFEIDPVNPSILAACDEHGVPYVQNALDVLEARNRRAQQEKLGQTGRDNDD